MQVLRVEWLKTKRTPIRWFVFLTPALMGAAIVGYLLLRGPMENLQLFAFQAVFEVWTALVIPIAVGVLTGFSIYQEEQAGDFYGLLGCRATHSTLYIGKFASMVWMASLSTALCVLISGIGMSLLLNMQVSWLIWICSTAMAIIGMLPLLALHLWASFAWGMGASIGIGGGGVLIAALMATSLGDIIWQFVPWAWPVRLSVLPGAYLLMVPDMHQAPPAIASGLVLRQLSSGLLASLTILFVALGAGLIWFKKWEGKKDSGL